MGNNERIAKADTERTWTIHRQDDAGNRFIVQMNLSQEEAERLVPAFTARGHKQLYWAEQVFPKDATSTA